MSWAALAFAFALLRRTEGNSVPNLGVSVAGVLLVASLMLFLIFLDRFLHRLRPVAVAVLVAKYVHRDFTRNTAVLAAPDIFWGQFEPNGEPPTLVVRSAAPGAVQAIDVKGLAAWAREHDCLIVVRRGVGDFVSASSTLIETYGGPNAGNGAERKLRGWVVLGAERTIEWTRPLLSGSWSTSPRRHSRLRSTIRPPPYRC